MSTAHSSEAAAKPAGQFSDSTLHSLQQSSLSPTWSSGEVLEMTESLPSVTHESTRPTVDADGALKRRLDPRRFSRRVAGIGLLLLTVFLWTLSNFLASDLFSDHVYNKPFFVVYINGSFFAMSTIPFLIRYTWKHGVSGVKEALACAWNEQQRRRSRIKPDEEEDNFESSERLLGDGQAIPDQDIEGVRHLVGSRRGAGRETASSTGRGKQQNKLSFGETARLSVEFSFLWVLANYFTSACFEYTTVSSGTILGSTSSVWTLIFCSVVGVETFTLRKVLGVGASLAGIVLISTVDLTGRGDTDRGSFPEKTTLQTAMGDAMALVSAMLYGIYVTVMKRRISDENSVNMFLFLGLVGVVSTLTFWPMFILLHFLGIEPFEMPPNGKIWSIILTNSFTSLASDITWAYAMLLTTPLVATVGLSLAIPITLIGQAIHYSQYSSVPYWLGAIVVVASFLFINHESHEDLAPVVDMPPPAADEGEEHRDHES